MSNEAIREFHKRIQEDEALRARLEELDALEGADAMRALVELAEASGYAFTVEELAAGTKSQLSDAQLEGVYGGGTSGLAASRFNASNMLRRFVCLPEVGDEVL